jgi:hypothetical protein
MTTKQVTSSAGVKAIINQAFLTFQQGKPICAYDQVQIA